MRTTKHIVSAAAVAVVGVAVAAGLVLLGPPAEERARRLDAQRVQDLRRIAQATDLYWTRHGRLPASLAEISSDAGASILSRDPVTTELYAYRILDGSMYELCGVFARGPSVGRPEGVAADFWSHRAGSQCFQLKVQEIRSETHH